jgi:hypothetical protein
MSGTGSVREFGSIRLDRRCSCRCREKSKSEHPLTRRGVPGGGSAAFYDSAAAPDKRRSHTCKELITSFNQFPYKDDGTSAAYRIGSPAAACTALADGGEHGFADNLPKEIARRGQVQPTGSAMRL